MGAYAYEDNFGFWDVDGPEERAFFEHVQGKSVSIACERCKCPVRLIPTKTVCASCVAALECGAPASMSEYRYGLKALLDPKSPQRCRNREWLRGVPAASRALRASS